MSALKTYGLCPACRRFAWHRPFGAGLTRCMKCGRTHGAGEVKQIEPPSRRNPAEPENRRLFE